MAAASTAQANDPITDPVPVGQHTVSPGEDHTNSDGVTVDNTGDPGDGDVNINPKTGNEGAATTVDVKNGASATVTGIDNNDQVNVSNGADADITGTGGTVDISAGGSDGTITNNGPAGGADITVITGGVDIKVPPR